MGHWCFICCWNHNICIYEMISRLDWIVSRFLKRPKQTIRYQSVMQRNGCYPDFDKTWLHSQAHRSDTITFLWIRWLYEFFPGVFAGHRTIIQDQTFLSPDHFFPKFKGPYTITMPCYYLKKTRFPTKNVLPRYYIFPKRNLRQFNRSRLRVSQAATCSSMWQMPKERSSILVERLGPWVWNT